MSPILGLCPNLLCRSVAKQVLTEPLNAQRQDCHCGAHSPQGRATQEVLTLASRSAIHARARRFLKRHHPNRRTGVKCEHIPCGGRAMATRTAFLMRSLHIFPILLSVICLLAAAEAQHGGGGGHSGGGHSGGGHFGGGHSSGRHSGGSHAGRHFGWLHVGSGKHSGPHAKFEASSPSSSPHPPSHLPTPGLMPFRPRISPTLLWSPSLFPPHTGGRVSFVSSHVRPHHHKFLRNRFPRFASSGCFFNGATEVCFFEPFLPLLSFSGDFDLFDSGFDLGGDSLDLSDGSQELTQSEMSAIPPTVNPSDDDAAHGNSTLRPGARLGAATEDGIVGKGVFLLVLKNGASHAVTDYWVVDGYLEYISPDGTRSHIPLEALDLQNTMIRNAPRGLPFVLRSTPAWNR